MSLTNRTHSGAIGPDTVGMSRHVPRVVLVPGSHSRWTFGSRQCAVGSCRLEPSWPSDADLIEAERSPTRTRSVRAVRRDSTSMPGGTGPRPWRWHFSGCFLRGDRSVSRGRESRGCDPAHGCASPPAGWRTGSGSTRCPLCHLCRRRGLRRTAGVLRLHRSACR
jgi:hypothetical protein